MYFSSALVATALMAAAQAQSFTPKGFEPSVKAKLEVYFNSTMVMTPGQPLTKSETAGQPKIAMSSAMADMAATYVFVMMDLDVPPAEGTTERRVLLHAMNTGFKATQQKLSGDATLLATSEKGPAAYIPPGPPATDTMPHRYVEMLFKQPAALSVKATDFADVSARIGFKLDEFMAKNGFDAPLAANFFTVDGKATGGKGGKGGASGTAAAGTATSTGGMPRNSIVPFTGDARRKDFSQGLAGVLGGLVLLAM